MTFTNNVKHHCGCLMSRFVMCSISHNSPETSANSSGYWKKRRLFYTRYLRSNTTPEFWMAMFFTIMATLSQNCTTTEYKFWYFSRPPGWQTHREKMSEVTTVCLNFYVFFFIHQLVYVCSYEWNIRISSCCLPNDK